MGNNKFIINKGYLMATLFLLGIEILIASYGRGFFRNYIGDVLAVVFIYSFLRSFYKGLKNYLPLYIFLISVSVELMQAFDVADQLSVASDSLLAIAIGRVFDWRDILCYALGSFIAYASEKIVFNKKENKI